VEVAVLDYGLKGKNVLVTGSTKGLGEAIVRILAGEGANVIVSGRSEDLAKDIAEKLTRDYEVKAVGIPADLGKRGVAQELFAKSLEALGGLDILVNNAGIWPTAYVREMTLEAFDQTLYMNLEVPFLLSKLMVNHLIEHDKKGKIVQVVSQAAFHGSTTGHAHYASSKAGLVTFSRSLAREVAGYGINVNSVAPGMMETPMVAEALEKKRDYYNGRIPIGRVATADEVAYAVAFLASNKADYLTGITIDATGGMLMR
jgi:3-oxoacyl-[acyl-carrier protein] reductase